MENTEHRDLSALFIGDDLVAHFTSQFSFGIFRVPPQEGEDHLACRCMVTVFLNDQPFDCLLFEIGKDSDDSDQTIIMAANPFVELMGGRIQSAVYGFLTEILTSYQKFKPKLENETLAKWVKERQRRVEEFEHWRLENEKYHLGDKRGRPSRSDSIYWHPAIFRQHYAEAVASLPENCRGDIDVAVAMGIDRKELYDLLKKHGIPRKHGAKRGRPRKSPAKNRHKS